MKPRSLERQESETSVARQGGAVHGARSPRRIPAAGLALLLVWVGSFGSPALLNADAAEFPAPPAVTGTNFRSFVVRGVVAAVDPDAGVVVVRHEAVPGYMGAMTMPFRVRPAEEMKGLQRGDTISFRLELTDAESWIGGIERTGTIRPGAETPARLVPPVAEPAAQAEHPLLDFQFTNELGRPVCLRDFRGEALAITFFFTRCPVPDFCPRLSKNFEAASRTLASMPRAPGNWHFLSVSFDPDFDTPAVLKAYAIRYQYDPARWSFLTGPRGEINELARLSGVVVDPEAGLFNHNFRTLIIGPDGQLQTSFPFGGDLSDAIVAAMLKACAASNSIAAGDANRGQEAPRPRIALNQPVPGNNR